METDEKRSVREVIRHYFAAFIFKCQNPSHFLQESQYIPTLFKEILNKKLN